MGKHLKQLGTNINSTLSSEQLDVLFILPPLYVFMKREFSSSRLGPGYLVSYLKERGITSRIYNADIYKPIYQEGPSFGLVLKKFVRAISGFTYFAKRWSSYYDQVNDLNNPIWHDLRTILRKVQPRIVGISASMVIIPSAAVAAKIIREELPGAKVIVGGPATTTCTEELIHNQAIDFLVLGEGEDTFVELASFLLGRKERPERLEEIRGIVYRNGAEIITTPSRPLIADIDSIPFPDRDSMFAFGDGGKFQIIHSNADLVASRGCPYPCKFCCSFVVWGTRKTRLRGVDNILTELIQLNRTYGQRSFVFWDDLFTVDRKRTIELCEKIVSNGLDIEWACLVRLNTIDAELLAIMKRAGCREIQLGIESGNDRILKHIGKDFTVAAIRDKVSIIKASGIEWGIFLIIGFPSETRAEMEETLRLINEIKPTWVSISIFTPYPGTDFFKELKEQGRIGDNFLRGDFWYPDNNYTGTMDDLEFKRFAIQALNYGDRYNMRRIFRFAYTWKKLRTMLGLKKQMDLHMDSKRQHSIEIMGMRVDIVQIPDIIQRMEEWIKHKEPHNYIVVANVDSAVRSKHDRKMNEAVKNSSLSIPDGFPLMLLGRLRGFSLKKRAYGPDLMSEFLKTNKDKGYTHFFYGATEDTLNKLIKNIKNHFPRLKIAGFYAPPFRALTPEEDASIVKMINDASPSVVWVGIGCPKQEIWMYEHKDKLNVPVMVGIGAAFDYLAGTKPQAPQWMRNNGFEWLFRLIAEPRRLWRRYLINNCIFLYYIAKEVISKKVCPYKKNSGGLI